MHDDAFCLFLIVACMTTLAVPSPGQIIVAVFGLALAVLAHFAGEEGSPGRPDHPDQREIENRRHAG